MSDPLHDALNRFMGVVKDQVGALREESRSLRAEMEAMRVEVRSVPEVPIEVREGPAGPAGEPGAPGADGRGIAAAEIRSGRLVLRFTDGEETDLGEVIGPPGERGADGLDGRDGEPGQPGADGERGADGAPGERGEPGLPGERGAPGERGERGADGITREEFDRAISEAEQRGFERGEREVMVRTLVDVHRGVWKPGVEYVRGDAVLWQGTSYAAEKDTTAQPDTSRDWKVIAHKGRDGKDRR